MIYFICDKCKKIGSDYVSLLDEEIEDLKCPNCRADLTHLHEVDEFCIPALKLLYNKGYETKYSCQSHIPMKSKIDSNPVRVASYICFKAIDITNFMPKNIEIEYAMSYAIKLLKDGKIIPFNLINGHISSFTVGELMASKYKSLLIAFNNGISFNEIIYSSLLNFIWNLKLDYMLRITDDNRYGLICNITMECDKNISDNEYWNYHKDLIFLWETFSIMIRNDLGANLHVNYVNDEFYDKVFLNINTEDPEKSIHVFPSKNNNFGYDL